MSRSPRFEVRSCRTGHLEEVYGSFVPAMTAANVLQREDGLSRFIVDTCGYVKPVPLRWRALFVKTYERAARGPKKLTPEEEARTAFVTAMQRPFAALLFGRTARRGETT